MFGRCRLTAVAVCLGLLAWGPRAHASAVSEGPLRMDSLEFRSEGRVRAHNLGGSSAFGITEVMTGGDDVLGMRGEATVPDAGGVATIDWLAGTTRGWQDGATFTLACDAEDAVVLRLVQVGIWFGDDGPLAATIDVLVSRKGQPVEALRLEEIGDVRFIPTGAEVTIITELKWQHGWPEWTIGRVGLEYLAVPGPPCVLVLAGALARRRRRAVWQRGGAA